LGNIWLFTPRSVGVTGSANNECQDTVENHAKVAVNYNDQRGNPKILNMVAINCLFLAQAHILTVDDSVSPDENT
jgi:hypothetical protein